MGNHIMDIEAVIDYMESHLDEKLDLEKVAEAVHYSKYYHLLSIETKELFIRCSFDLRCIRTFHPKFLQKKISALLK